MKKVLISLFAVISFLSLILGFFICINKLYPLYYRNELLRYSKEFNLDPSLIASIINVESGYDYLAVSDVGAKGLMQIKDSTALEIAQKLKINEYKVNDIFDADLNIRFGCFYINYLLDYYDKNLDLALSAYNAGMGTVNSWMKNINYYENGMLKKVPYKETEGYLNKIENGRKIYKYLHGLN